MLGHAHGTRSSEHFFVELSKSAPLNYPRSWLKNVVPNPGLHILPITFLVKYELASCGATTSIWLDDA